GRGRVKDPFVDHVDDISLDAGWKLTGKVAREKYGGFGMDRKVPVPQLLVHIEGTVRIKDRGIVDEDGEGTEESGGIGDEGAALGAIGEISADGDGATATGL